ncbi:lactococcin 972 family bacteriocin [Lysinibacillus xylanilyticus]|uniref:lactococcin 972 family bacteriocin n=1 Tax=Lysinibacillus xylanilyticus TaxID=582475 RepID=UPI003D07FCA2
MIKKSFRGILAGLAVCTCLSVSAKGASAEELSTDGGGIDLDALIAQEETGSFLIDDTIDDTNNNTRAAVRAAAGGGTFNVYWGLDRHTSEYNHPSKVHKSSAGNWSMTRHSKWEAPGNLAAIWIKSSLWGNTANWDVK